MEETNRQGQLVIRLLGDPEVRRGTALVREFDSSRLRSLLAYLIVRRDRAIARHRMAFEFWPDSTDAQARTNLRQALHHLRHALGDADRYVRLGTSSVQWLADSPAEIDVVGFEADATAGLASDDEEALARAASRYRGDFLAGCYDEWAAPERERLRALAVAVLRALVKTARRRGDWARAVDDGERLLRLDPLDESSYRLLIEAHASAGDRARALRLYHECVAVLDRELAVGPHPDTIALYEALMTRGGLARADDPTSAPVWDRLPLIGRDHELGELVAAWHQTAPGRPRFVLVAGEPGIGKSRLVEELLTLCRREGATTVATRAYEAHGAQPYGPLIDVLRADVMRPSIAALDPGLRRELGRVLPEATGDEPAVESPGRETQRRRLFEAIGRVLVGGRRELVLVIDDLHWCDPDTLELLEFVIRSASSSPNALLVVATIRQEELISQPTLRPAVSRLCAASEAAAELSLGRLDAVDAAELVSKVTGARVTGSAFERLIASAEGNPLFLVEMARSGLLRGSSPTTELHLPPKVQAVIDTRLDQLSETARDLASVAAVVGRSFTIDLIGNLVADGRDAMTALDELWRRGIIRERGAERYDFSHDRIRDVAYHRLGPAHRRTLHAAVAVALEHGGGAEPGQIADHLERAGQIEAAIAAYRRAVDIAARAFAHQDVIGHCRRALRLVAGRPPGPSRDDVELAFLVPLGVALMTGPGVGDADLNVYERAHAIRTQRGLAADPSTLRLWANAAIGRRDYPKARRLGETLLRRGCDEHDRVLVTEGHYLIGVTSFWLGDLDVSRRSLEDALASHQPRHTPVHLERFGQDPRTVCLVRLALTSFHLGDVATAAERCAEALEASAGVGHEYTDVYVRMFAAWYLAEAGREDEAAQLVDRMPAATPNPMASIARAQFTGWARSRRGDPASGARLLREAQHEAHHRGPQMFEPFTLILLARSCLAAGDLSEALDAALAARAIAASEMPFHLPEATRLTGELMLAGGHDPGQALDVLGEAADVAARYGAAVHELRARTSLLRAARAHSPTSVPAHERALAAVHARLAWQCGLEELAAARHELRPRP